MFEDITYERLLQDVLDNAPPGIDTRQGSIFYDSVSGVLLEIAKLYTDLDLVIQMTTVRTATGDALDTKAEEYGVYRLQATPAKYLALFDGTIPQVGERFYYDLAYFVLKQDEDTGTYFFEAEVPGEQGNNIYAGTPAVPVNYIEGLISATFGEIYEHGSDAEDDESFRERVLEKIAGPAENGNKQHYKTWCESIDGVGRARIVPLWNGENTVKAVLIDTTGQPLGEAKVKEVQGLYRPRRQGHDGRRGRQDIRCGRRPREWACQYRCTLHRGGSLSPIHHRSIQGRARPGCQPGGGSHRSRRGYQGVFPGPGPGNRG